MNALTAKPTSPPKMNIFEFELNIQFAEKIGGDYALGYQRGLKRRFHGETFSTEDLHLKWMKIGIDDDYRPELGIGYRDGFAGRPPMHKRRLELEDGLTV